jgi:flagellar motility protein MotE (MotC chaperone)
MSKSFQSCQEIVNKESCQKILKNYEKENIGNESLDSEESETRKKKLALDDSTDDHLDQLERQRQETKRNIEELDRKMETVRRRLTFRAKNTCIQELWFSL